MKKFILNFALLFLAGSSFSANEIRSKQIEDIYSCTQMTVTLGCGAQYEYCMGEGMEGLIAYWNTYVYMNNTYCNDQPQPPQL
jgi:hypothetical protein